MIVIQNGGGFASAVRCGLAITTEANKIIDHLGNQTLELIERRLTEASQSFFILSTSDQDDINFGNIQLDFPSFKHDMGHVSNHLKMLSRYFENVICIALHVQMRCGI